MARKELHTDDLGPVEQEKTVIENNTNEEHEGEIVLVERIGDLNYLEQLAAMEEPVVIRLEPSADKNASKTFPVWVNGKPAEIFINNRWIECGWLPVSQVLTVKRKTVEVIIRAKVDTVNTNIENRESERPNNTVTRFTTPVHSFSILQDKNQLGAAWVQEMHRRYL
jgi:hypothetical protein